MTKLDGTTDTFTQQDNNTTYSAGSGLNLSGTTFSHANTSSQASLTASNRTYIKSLTLDTYGHVTALTTGTETVTDTNTTYRAGTGISLSGTTFSNSGVRSVATGSSNGTISVNTNGTATNVAVKGLAAAAYRDVRSGIGVTHTNYGINNSDVPDMSFLAYWNGSYSSSGASNLNYCAEGAFGSIVTKNAGDYVPIRPNQIEFGTSSSAGHGGYLDFHYNGSSSDHTSRIIESASGTLSLNDVKIKGSTITGSLSGNASTASKLQPHSGVTTNDSSWDGAAETASSTVVAWRQAFKNSNLGSDSGDLVLKLRAGQYSSGGTELCMMIDGDYYSMGNKVLHAGNYSSYAAPASHSHSYLPLSGGTMSGSSCIKFPAAPGTISASDPLAITYGRISAYGTLCINANTDNSGEEYVILTAGKGLSGATADGLAIGTSTLTWQNKNILHAGNWSSYCAPASHSHSVDQLTWGGAVNLSCTGADTEWSIDMHAQATNSYFHIWSGILGKSCMQFENSTGLCRAPTGVYGGVWNDYAEFRDQEDKIEPGYCVTSSKSGKVSKTIKRMQYCEGIVSDTFGFAIGETNECKTPLAVSGRALAYYSGDIEAYDIGDVVCADVDGKVTKMTREEIKEYPDRIVGTVSEIPSYDTWGEGNVPTAGRIWIKVK